MTATEPVDPTTGFRRLPATRWLSPGLLLREAGHAAISQTLGRYQDKRETLGSLPADRPLDLHTGRRELWFDYVSDTGDGFDATYAVASLVAEPELELPGHDGVPGLRTPRGDLLVLGGDECYPRGEPGAYEDRFLGPYGAALPEAPPDRQPPWMLAVPGNHDWYDGLTAFLRAFCQQRPVGGWRTTQSRSYFAARLPGRWWLWAIDIQFDSYIDLVQHRWLQQMSDQLAEGDAVVLCTAKPAWVSTPKEPDAYATLDFVERTFVTPRGATVRVVLSGDLHHYSRFEGTDGRQLVTAGGGGAYLTPTHHLPSRSEAPSRRTSVRHHGPHVDLERRAVWPDPDTSRGLARGIVRLPLDTPWFAVLIGGLHALVAFTLLRALAAEATTLPGRIREAAAGLEGLDLVGEGAIAPRLLDSTLSLLVALLVLGATVAFTRGLTGTRLVIGLGHGIVHLAVALVATWAAARIAAGLLGGGEPSTAPALLALVCVLLAVAVVGAVLGSLLVAAYLWLADLARVNSNELYAAQAIEGYKNFLRLHVDERGTLTIHPVGLARVPSRWRPSGPRPDGRTDAPALEPLAPLEPALIEPPVPVTPGPGAP